MIPLACSMQARDWDHDHLDDGGRELTAGVIGALALRRMIQEAIRTLASTTADSAGAAYHQLCAQAAESGTSLVDMAAQVIERHRTGR